MPPLRIIAPLLAVFVVFVAVVAMSWAHPRGPARVERRGFVRALAVSAVAGYAVFLAIVILFHVVIARQRDALRYAIPGGALLAFAIAVPSFCVLTGVERAVRSRRVRR